MDVCHTSVTSVNVGYIHCIRYMSVTRRLHARVLPNREMVLAFNRMRRSPHPCDKKIASDDVLGIVLSFHEQNNNFMRARAATCIQSRWRDKMLRELQKARQNAQMMMNLLYGGLGLRVYQIQYLMDAQNS